MAETEQDRDPVFEDLLERLVAEEDLAEQLRKLRSTFDAVEDLSTRLRTLRSSTIAELRELDWTWSEVGEVYGVTGQRAGQLA